MLFPSSITTYAEFKKSYPHGQLLAKPERFDKGSHYADYFSDSTKLGIFGRIDNFRRIPGKTKVIGLRLKGHKVAVTYDKLAESKLVLVDKVDPPVVVIYDATSQTALAYELVGLSAKQAAEISVTGSVLTAAGANWDIRSGKPTDGKSKALKPVPLITAFWFAWASFFPTSELIE